MVVTHRIDLTEAPKGKAFYSYNGQRLGVSNHPICSAARKLLESGVAFHDDRIETYRGDMRCLSAQVDVAARLTVKEPDRGGVYFVKHSPTPQNRQKPLSYYAEAS